MRLNEYTADTICAALGLGGFFDPSWTPSGRPALRLLLKPSFDPEVCLTFVRGSEVADLMVATSETMVWHCPAPGLVPTFRDQGTIATEAFDAMTEAFDEASADRSPADRWVVIDGMSAEGCLVSAASLRRFREHTAHRPVGRLAALALTLSWGACRDTRVRNRLAAAARYVGVERPEEPEPLLPAVTKVAVIGTPDDRADLLRLLRNDTG